MTQNTFSKVLFLASFSLLLGFGLTLKTNPVLAQQTTTPALNAASISSLSKNWSGYRATGGTFTGVGGSWTVPKSSAAGTSADATWIGIGGVSTRDLIQTGTNTVFTNGQASYRAWYELLPANSREIPLAISPGDSITASISRQSNNSWHLSFADNTSGKNYQTDVNYSSSQSSAEWIEEALSSGRSIIPLDNFGTVNFSGLWTVENGTRLTPAQAGAKAIAMSNDLGQTIARSSVLGSDGASFAISRTDSTSRPLALFSRGGGWRRVALNIRSLGSNWGYMHRHGRFSEGS